MTTTTIRDGGWVRPGGALAKPQPQEIAGPHVCATPLPEIEKKHEKTPWLPCC